MAPPATRKQQALIPEIVVSAYRKRSPEPSTRLRLKRWRDEYPLRSSTTSTDHLDPSNQDDPYMVPSGSDGDGNYSDTKPRPAKKRKLDTPLKSDGKTSTPPFPTKQKRKRVNYKIEMLWKMLDNRDHDLAKSQWYHNRLQEKFDELEAGKLANSRNEVNNKNIKIGELRDKASDKNEKLTALKQENKTLKERLQRQEATIQDFQNQWLSKLDNSDFMVDPDNEVARIISRLFRSTKNFSSKHSLRDWGSVSSKARESICGIVADTEMPGVASDPRGFSAIRHGLIPVRVVVNSLLNLMLVDIFLVHPFSIVAAHGKSYKSSTVKVLQQIYKTSLGDPVAAARFRCLSAASLLPARNHAGDDNETETPNKHIVGFANEVTSAILKKMMSLIHVTKDPVAEIEKELRKTALAFVEVSIRIHSQYPHTQFLFQADLQEESFSMDSDRLQAHPAMQLKDDEDDGEGKTAQDAGVAGLAPDLIIEPLVVRSGDKQGKIWDANRVLQRALVWICGPEDINKARQAELEPASPSPRSIDKSVQTAPRGAPFETSSHATTATLASSSSSGGVKTRTTQDTRETNGAQNTVTQQKADFDDRYIKQESDIETPGDCEPSIDPNSTHLGVASNTRSKDKEMVKSSTVHSKQLKNKTQGGSAHHRKRDKVLEKATTTESRSEMRAPMRLSKRS